MEVGKAADADNVDVLTAGQAVSLKEANRQKEREFKIDHALLLGFLSLIIILHVLGIYLFTSGFLLTRLVLDNKSECAVPPIALHGSYEAGSSQTGCWHPKSFEKAVIIIIDALRYDFTVPFSGSSDQSTPRHYHNALPVLYQTALQNPQNAFLRPFIADPPTTTLQRLKGLMTGTLPTFIEGGSNFAADSIEEDTIISQLSSAGKRIVQLGDDTWQALFPHHFDAELTRPFDSFNVPDLHTVDNGVIAHLMPLLHPSNHTRWDVIIGHGLGVDHVGHNFGPDHPEMPAKLEQMNQMIEQTMLLIDDNTLLVVMGDHGMDSKGNHGGESDDEVEAALWMYSKRKIFGRSSEEHLTPPVTAKERPVPQIDLVPTLALLLGLPIPFNNLGAPIEEAFIGSRGADWQNMAYVNRLAAAQIHRFQEAYALVRTFDSDALALPHILWHASTENWAQKAESRSKVSSATWEVLAGAFASYQRQNLAMFRALWARFDMVNMSMGVSVLLLTLLVMVFYAHGISGKVIDPHRSLVYGGAIALILGAVGGFSLSTFIPILGQSRTTAFSSSMLTCVTLLFTLFQSKTHKSFPLPTNFWTWTSLISVILLAASFGSNSYTVWEEESLLFILGTFGTMLLPAAFRLKRSLDRTMAFYHITVFMILLRVASFARICREEQMPECTPIFYASSSSTTSAGWRLSIPYLVAVALPSLIQAHYAQTSSWQGSAPVWVGIAFRTALFGIAAVWTLDAVDMPIFGVSISTLKLVRIAIAQLVLMTAVGAGGATFGWMPPLLGIERAQLPSATVNGTPGRPQLIMSGSKNLYGSHFSILPFTVLMIPLLLLSKPMGQMSIFCVALAILSLLEFLSLVRPLDSTSSSTSTSTITSTKQTKEQPPKNSSVQTTLAPTILAILAHFLYFKTGHQATLSSIQWDSAFIPLSTNRLPWSAIFVTLNTFAGQILTAAAVPAFVLWRRPFNFSKAPSSSSSTSAASTASAPGPSPGAEAEETIVQTDTSTSTHHRREILSELGKAQITHFLVYAVINLATTVFAAHLRRHLMLYRVFCPRWMLGSVGMVVAEVAGTFIGVAGTAWSLGSLGGLFGW